MTATNPGWYADPVLPNTLRYWDGQQWTSETQAMPAPPADSLPNPTAGHPASAPQSNEWAIPTKEPWHKSKPKFWGAIAAGVLVAAIAFGGGGSDDTPAASDEKPPTETKALVADATPTDIEDEDESSPPKQEVAAEKPKKKPAPKAPSSQLPGPQQSFVQLVATGKAEAEAAENDLRVGAALTKRNQGLCQLLGAGNVNDWVGSVKTLDSNGDGHGILTLEFGDDIEAGTWNNAFSDMFDETLIKPGPLYDTLLTLAEGQQVRFSGQFMKQNEDCGYTSNMTQVFDLSSPDFIFKFSRVQAVN